MAGGKLNYRVQAQLDTKGFKSGANVLRREFASLKSGIMGFTASLGASLGLFNILSKMKDVATDLNVARATLENTSKSLNEYRSNLAFVDRLSTDYNQDLITLTDSFAKFHAAAMGTNFSLTEQKDIYEGLTRAAAFYHMSTERTHDMMVAIEQIMSKGKVTAEELRRQLGNNLPGAYAKMAKAAVDTGYAGVKSFADFEKAMKAGKIGADLLTQFVKNLNEETKNINLDSLQLQANALSNAFTRFVESTQFEDFLSKLYKKTAAFLDWLTAHFNSVLHVIEIALGTFVSVKVVKLFKAIGAAYNSMISSLLAATRKGSTAANVILKSWRALLVFMKGWGGFATAAIAGVTFMVSKSIGVWKNLKGTIDDATAALRRYSSIKWKDQDVWERHEQAKADRDWAEQYLSENYNNYFDWKRQLANLPEATYLSPTAVVARNEEQKLLEAKIDAYKQMLKLYNTSQKKLWEVEKEIEELIAGEDVSPTGNTISGGDAEKDTVQKALEKYVKERKELENQLNAHAISLDEFNDEMVSLTDKSWKAVTAFDNFRGEIALLSKSLQDAAGELEDDFGNQGLNKSLIAITDAAKDYYKEQLKNQALLNNDKISKKEYNDELEKAGEKALEAMMGIKNLETVLSLLDPITQQIVGNIIKTYSTLHQAGIDKRNADFLKRVEEAQKAPNIAARWNYRDTSDKFYDKMANAWAKKVDEYQELVDNVIEDTSLEAVVKLETLQKLLEDAKNKAQNFRDMADLSEWAQEIKELKKEYRKESFNGIKGTADAMDRLVSGAKAWKETIEDVDASAWDKIITSINTLIQTIDTLNSLIETFNNLSEIGKNLKRAQDAEELKALGQKYVMNGAIIEQKSAEMAVDALAESQTKKNIQASLAAQSAQSGEAIAGATASGAKMPFPYNIIAIAAGVAAVIGALSSIKKYATGGIVKGSLHGDRNIVGVNGNEMILNTNQQGRLWGMLNGRGDVNGTGGKVEFVISGSNLRGVLKNEEKIRTGRS